MKKLLLAVALSFVIAGSAQAYTAYLRPSEFYPDDARVTVQGSFATSFFEPGIALSGNFVFFEPAGTEGVFSQVEVGTDTSRLGASLTESGTYRITTGEILGQVATLVAENGTWRALAAGEVAPADAQTTTLQTVTLSDVYVTRGAPSRENVDSVLGRLALRPVTHPNEVLAANGFQVQALFDGQPFANAALVLYSEGDPETDLDTYFATDANGNATITLPGPGTYVLAARHRANAPAGAAAQVQSYTTTLTFEALAQLYPISEVREVAPTADRHEERRRRRDPRLGRGG
jgi:hypothetical protein